MEQEFLIDCEFFKAPIWLQRQIHSASWFPELSKAVNEVTAEQRKRESKQSDVLEVRQLFVDVAVKNGCDYLRMVGYEVYITLKNTPENLLLLLKNGSKTY